MTLLTARRWRHRGPGEVVVLDNRDSFVFNLAHRFHEVGLDVVVVRSDAVSAADLASWRPRALVLSPGPGRPDGAGASVEAVRRFSGHIPILGVCLGHQAIVEAFGGTIVEGGRPCHGKATEIAHDQTGVFAGLSTPSSCGRYHSLVAAEPLPEALRLTARGGGFVMGVEHVSHPTWGVQFHPESVLTGQGREMLSNFARQIS